MNLKYNSFDFISIPLPLEDCGKTEKKKNQCPKTFS